jgi:hypothetical protein
MKKKAIDIVNKILALKQRYDSMPPLEPANLMVMTTTDGVDVSMDKMDVGGIATINGLPAPANTYTFTDGSSITTDATGAITAATPASTPAPAPAPVEDKSQTPAPAKPAPVPTPAPAPAPMPQAHQSARFAFTEEHKTADGIDKLFASIALAGTPEERITNLETVCKAMMEYCFGWEIKQVKEKTDRDNAIKVYTESLAPLQQQMEAQKKTIAAQKEMVDEMIKLVQEFVDAPVSNPPQKTKTVFSNVKPKGSIERYAAAAQKVYEEKHKS